MTTVPWNRSVASRYPIRGLCIVLRRNSQRSSYSSGRAATVPEEPSVVDQKKTFTLGDLYATLKRRATYTSFTSIPGQPTHRATSLGTQHPRDYGQVPRYIAALVLWRTEYLAQRATLP